MYRASGGKFGGSVQGSPLLLLTVTGRKSGREYTYPLAYVVREGEYLITASAAGSEKNPEWLANLRRNPHARILVKDQTYDVTATITTGAERDKLYELFKAQGENFRRYEQQTKREIPVIRLHTQPAIGK